MVIIFYTPSSGPYVSKLTVSYFTFAVWSKDNPSSEDIRRWCPNRLLFRSSFTQALSRINPRRFILLSKFASGRPLAHSDRVVLKFNVHQLINFMQKFTIRFIFFRHFVTILNNTSLKVQSVRFTCARGGYFNYFNYTFFFILIFTFSINRFFFHVQ